MDRLKILDCDRKRILLLDGNALKVWMCYWMHEDEGNESYLSVRTISAKTRLDAKTVTKWKKFLIAGGWLVPTGETAADKYGDKATRGSHKVQVIRVDDPTKSVGKIPTAENPSNQDISTVGKSLIPKISHKGSSSGFGSGSGFPASSLSGSHYQALSKPPAEEPDPLEEKLKPKPKPKTAPDGVPYPDGFDSWENQARLDWLSQHGLKVGPLPKIKGTLEYDRAMRDGEERRRQEFEEELCREPEAYRPPWAREGSSVARQEKNPKPKAKYFPDPCVNCGMDEGYGRFGLCARCQTDDAAMRKAEEGVFIPRCAHRSGSRRCLNDAVGGTFCSEHKNKE